MLLNFVGQVATLIVGFLPSVLVARWLGPSGRGLLAVITTSGSIAFILLSLGLPVAVLYYASQRRPPSGALLANSALYAGVLATIVVPVTWVLRHQIAEAMTSGRGEWAWVLAAVSVPLTFFEYATHNQLLGRLRFGYFNAFVVASELVSLVAVVVLLRVVHFGVAGVVIASILASLMLTGGSLRVIFPGARIRVDRELLRKMFAYGQKSQVNSVFNYVNARFDVLILHFFVPLAAIGYYVIAQFLAELVTVLTRSFQQSVTSLVAKDSHDSSRQAATTVTSLRHHGLLAAAAIVVNAVLGPVLVLVAYGHAYTSAIVPFFIVLPGMWFLGNGFVIANDLNGRNRPGLASSLSGVGALVTLVFDFALIPFFGIVGAAVASLVAYCVFGVASMIVEARIVGVSSLTLLPTRREAVLYPRAASELFRRFLTRSTKPVHVDR